MKKILFILFGVTIANGCSQKEIVLRTMTYNTYSGRNAGIEAIADAIRRNNPDLVALQEVERFTELNPGDTPAVLAEMTGLKYHAFIHALDIRTGGDYGNVILSKYPILEERSFRLGKLPVPIVYNCGGYERVETLRELEGLVDIYLPDMKYSNESLAAKLSRAPDYVETAKAAIQEMYRQVGSAVIEDDIMQRGLIVRHLILPGELDNTLGVLDWFAETFPKGDVLFSLMSQYVPMGKAKELPPYDRKITEEEYDAAISYLDFLGIESGFTQDFTSATEDYIPDFSFEGLE